MTIAVDDEYSAKFIKFVSLSSSLHLKNERVLFLDQKGDFAHVPKKDILPFFGLL